MVELPLDEEEIIHDEGVDLCELVDGAIEDIEGDILLEIALVDEPVDVQEDIHGDIDGIP